MGSRTVNFKGKPVTLEGKEVKVGDKAPDVELTDNNLGNVKLSSFLGSTCIISAVVSLDTPVCDTQTHKFNEAVDKMGDNVKVITVSMDLPFAQKRWCGSAGTKGITLSDYKNAEFGNKYGLLMKDLHLLSRAVFVVDKNGVVRHVHYGKEVSEHPDYDKILKEVEQVRKSG